MEKTIESVRNNFNSIRTGRSNPAMLDKIEVCWSNYLHMVELLFYHLLYCDQFTLNFATFVSVLNIELCPYMFHLGISLIMYHMLCLKVEYYGSPVGLKTIAQISTPDSNSLLVQPYDKSRYSVLY